AASPRASMVLGAGLGPGLSTRMAASPDNAPGDDVDVALMLGVGEKHGPAAVAWIQRLIGTPLAGPAENRTVMKLHERRSFNDGDRSRRHLGNGRGGPLPGGTAAPHHGAPHGQRGLVPCSHE
ncbi:MAG: hypothetical protein ABI563_17955, partial [Specibacter sp.]